MRVSSYRWIVPILLAVLISPVALADEPTAPAADATQGVAFEPGTPPLADILVKATAEKKPAFLDFYTDT
jgi:hypothetical protein